MPFKNVSNTWSGIDLELRARSNSLHSLTWKESFVVLENEVVMGTRNASERFVPSVGDRIKLQKRTLEVSSQS